MRPSFRLTVRARLALLLATLVVVSGVVLLAVNAGLAVASIIRAINAARPAAGIPPPAGQSRRVASASFSVFLVQDAVVLAGLVAVAGGVAWLVAGRMLRPLRQITETARRITGEGLHERLALGGPADELTELGDTIDGMLARLEAAFADQQLFAANAAHELRTPLAVMRAELDLLLTGPEPSPAEVREAAARLRRTVLGSERLLERLLTLTRGMLAPGDRQPLALDETVRQALAARAENASARGLTLRTELGEARAYGDPELLAELAGNLLDNAVKYNRPDGWIAVATGTGTGRAVLEISNSGPPVAQAELAGLVEPFRRASQQRIGGSSGLGLSIVRSVVAAHGGELSLRALPDGGLAVRVSLRVAPAAPDGPDAAG